MQFTEFTHAEVGMAVHQAIRESLVKWCDDYRARLSREEFALRNMRSLDVNLQLQVDAPVYIDVRITGKRPWYHDSYVFVLTTSSSGSIQLQCCF